MAYKSRSFPHWLERLFIILLVAFCSYQVVYGLVTGSLESLGRRVGRVDRDTQPFTFMIAWLAHVAVLVAVWGIAMMRRENKRAEQEGDDGSETEA